MLKLDSVNHFVAADFNLESLVIHFFNRSRPELGVHSYFTYLNLVTFFLLVCLM